MIVKDADWNNQLAFYGDVLPKTMRSKRQKKIKKAFKAHAVNDGYLADFFEKKTN